MEFVATVLCLAIDLGKKSLYGKKLNDLLGLNW